MELKRNEATLNRPEGDRVLDAPYVFMDLDDFVKQLKDEKAWDKNDRNGITIFKTDNLTTVLTCLHKGAEIKDNTVPDVKGMGLRDAVQLLESNGLTVKAIGRGAVTKQSLLPGATIVKGQQIVIELT